MNPLVIAGTVVGIAGAVIYHAGRLRYRFGDPEGSRSTLIAMGVMAVGAGLIAIGIWVD